MTLAQLATLLTLPEGGTSDIANVITQLKGTQPEKDLASFRKQFDPKGHDSVDKVKRPDRKIKKETDQKDKDGKTIYQDAIAPVNRLSLSLQKIITARAVSFLFGNPVKIVCDAKAGKAKQVLDALIRVLYDTKIDSFNRRIAREMFRTTEVAECWFTVVKEEEHEDYGFKTKFKLRVVPFATWDGNELFPLFDETGDMIAFSRAYTLKDDTNKDVQYFETYTASEKIIWIQSGGGWSEKSREKNVIGKIPVVYGHQEQVEWADVQTAIDRLEYLLSNFADTNDYHAAPKIFVEGQIVSMSEKGSSNGILQGTQGSKAYYLSWDHATDAVKLEIETLLRFIYSFTQTPDISFDSVKGLREISGEALKMLFLDAHLKVQDKREVFDEYLQRRINIIKSFIGTMATGLKAEASAVKIEADIQPFIINDQKAMIDLLSEATGGKPMLSQQTAVSLTGLVDDAQAEYTQLQTEQEAERTVQITEPTV